MKTIARLAAALFTASLFVAPISALADEPAPPKQILLQSYPMKESLYEPMMAERIAKLKLQTEQAIKKQNLSAEKRAQVEKVLANAVRDVESGIDSVTADRTVTRPESKQVDGLMDAARSQVSVEIGVVLKEDRIKLGKLVPTK